MLEQGVPSDDLEKISDVVENNIKHLGENIINAVKNVVHREFDDVKDVVSEIDSESTLDDHIIMLKKIGERASISSQKIDGAVEIAQSRIAELQEEEVEEARTPDLVSSANKSTDKFDDLALNNLFTPLLDV